ncbi:hypothetical protein Ga0123461_0707 [Mariprofundus aestuarium]|uniref:Uncharacterized protein n=1 Tax=Mariprofundus aestuarium TaxID=1921086 RepID=A0A2K8KWF9_MARES|nr:anti-phage protein KwaA [Mariprofundus aestuarium]ATX79133.1 hypothetical protein Ga0123461_0707 [Mariprofundus aestuarium]
MPHNQVIEKFELYIVSLWLLFLLIVVVTVDIPICFGDGCTFIGFGELLNRNVVPAVAIIFIVFGMIYFLRFNYKIAGSKSNPVTIESVEDMNYEHLTFLTTYIIPLICFNLTSTRYLIALGVLLFVIGIIYVKTDKFYANPTLAILGFRLYSAVVTKRTGEKVKVVLITKSHLQDGKYIQYLELDSRVYFAKERS